MNKIIKGDDVIVLAGRDKGKRGTVLRILNDRQVLVDSVNVVKKHVRPNPNKGETGGIIQKEMPVALSNVAVYNPNSSKGDRIGIKWLEDGRKVRFFKSDGEVIDQD
jgi:large subunit ribosomal protein L24